MDEHSRKLYEEYEEALFAVIMDQIAEVEGKRLAAEAKQLEAEGFQVPATLDEKCLKIIRNAERQERRRQRAGTIKRAGKVVLLAAALMTLLFSAVYAASPAFRADVKNWTLTFTEDGTEIRLSPDDLTAESMFTFIYIPAGFSKMEVDYTMVCFVDADANGIYGGFMEMNENTKIIWDTEDAEVEYTAIHGYDGMIAKKIDPIEGRQCVDYVWFDSGRSCLMYVSCYGLPVEEAEAVFNGCVISE